MANIKKIKRIWVKPDGSGVKIVKKAKLQDDVARKSYKRIRSWDALVDQTTIFFGDEDEII